VKKILVFLIAVLLFSVAHSQTSFTGTSSNSSGAIYNTTVDTLNLIMSGSYNEAVGIQVVATKTSGTMAGTVRLYGSIFGTTGTWEAVGDTLTLANQTTNSHYWTVTQPTYKYFRILQSGGTTVAGTLAAKALGIKPN